eukprot:TRINITY_DN9024_c0_g1_i3.p1 TRINITY_DN9024_c0_g1~~TRINITY_DN9024_c0_g1_i3.p1  ORF type:complete len:424 (-),score=102.23 TRINITY_DN9024_c0_g1_i3:168-1439(-)
MQPRSTISSSDELTAALSRYGGEAVEQPEGVAERAENVGGPALPITCHSVRRKVEDVDAAAPPSSSPGELLELPFAEALMRIEDDLLKSVCAAGSYPLLAACEARPAILEHFVQVANGITDAWDEIMCRRIGDSWRSRYPETIWLDDKVEQVARASTLCGKVDALHLPIYAHAAAGDAADAQRALAEAAAACVARGEKFVIKPRHGANSCCVFMCEEPEEATAEAIAEGVRMALRGTDPSWQKECWQLSQVPKGALVQPMYAIAVPRRADGGPKSRSAPLELKVQVLFGKVVGGTLNTHPQVLWVTADGAIQQWQTTDLQAAGHVRCSHLDRVYGLCAPDGAIQTLQDALRSDWHHIRYCSEEMVKQAHLDELRVDWLLGDGKWGSRIGELTYMGAGSRLTPAISRRLARASHKGFESASMPA